MKDENQTDIKISKEEFMKIIELTGLPISHIQKLIDLEKAEQEEAKRKELEKKNPPFIQLYKSHMKEIRWLITNHHLSSNILFFFLENMNNRNIIVCSQQLLMEQFNKGRTTIHNAIKTLKEHGFISIAKIGNANAYIINPEIAFQDSRDKIKYVSFEGKILINKNENEELFKEHNFENLKVLKDENK